MDTREERDAHAIVFKDVWKVYQLGKVSYPALRGLSVEIKRGELVAVMGPSGSGKSTFLHIAGTLDRPTRGKVLIKGVDVTKLNDKELSALRNRSIGFVFQAYNLVPRLTALENVELPLMARGIDKKRREMAMEALRLVGLADKYLNKPTELSGGEQQRVAIARAIVGRPEIVLADEPTGNLDSKNSEVIVNLLKELNKKLGSTIVIVTHNPEVARATDRVLMMRDGVIVSEEVLTYV